MEVKIDRVSTWGIHITRSDGDEGWPDVAQLPANEAYQGRNFRPGSLHTTLRENGGGYHLTVHGKLLNKEGQPGKVSVHGRWLPRNEEWEWAHAILEKARQSHALGPGTTGVDW